MFKNAIPYRLTEELIISDFNEKLEARKTSPLLEHDIKNFGWTAPSKDDPDLFYKEVLPGIAFVKMQINEKIMPASVVNEALNEAVEKIEKSEGRKLKRKERTAIKDEIIFNLLPRAFVKVSHVDAFINYEENLIVVDAASATKAEDLLGFLRKTIGSLPLTPIVLKRKFGYVLNKVIRGQAFIGPNLLLTDSFVIADPEDSNKQSRLKGFTDTDEVEQLLESGGVITEASMIWQEELEFKVKDNLIMKGVKDNTDHDYEDDDSYSEEGVATALGLTALIKDLIDCFGGEQ